MPLFLAPPSTSTPQGTSGVPEIPTNGQIGEPTYGPYPLGTKSDDIVYESFTAKATTEQGQNVAILYSTFKFNRWPKGISSMYCTVRMRLCACMPCPVLLAVPPIHLPFPPFPPPPSADP